MSWTVYTEKQKLISEKKNTFLFYFDPKKTEDSHKLPTFIFAHWFVVPHRYYCQGAGSLTQHFVYFAIMILLLSIRPLLCCCDLSPVHALFPCLFLPWPQCQACLSQSQCVSCFILTVSCPVFNVFSFAYLVSLCSFTSAMFPCWDEQPFPIHPCVCLCHVSFLPCWIVCPSSYHLSGFPCLLFGVVCLMCHVLSV